MTSISERNLRSNSIRNESSFTRSSEKVDEHKRQLYEQDSSEAISTTEEKAFVASRNSQIVFALNDQISTASLLRININLLKQQNRLTRTHMKQIQQIIELRTRLEELTENRRRYSKNDYQYNSRKRASISKISKKQDCFNYQSLIIWLKDCSDYIIVNQTNEDFRTNTKKSDELRLFWSRINALNNAIIRTH